MTQINYQALREAAERAIPAMERLLMLPADDDLLSEQELKDYGVDIDALNAFKFLAGPETVLALLDEINALEETRINDVCRIAELTKQLELAKSKLNEQREYYEGVISDGSKRIAELEAREVVLPRAHDVHPLGPQSAKIFCEFHRSIVNRCADEIRKVGVKVSIKGN